METRAHNALIGLFTLAVVAAALGFVVWFARISDRQTLKRYEIEFPGSVTGLTIGSSVTFNGIRVGQVETLDINPKDPSGVVATVSVKQTTPVHTDTSARLEFAGLTGGGNVQLIGGKLGAADLLPEKGEDIAVIKAQPSELQNLVDGARETVKQASSTMERVNALISDNQANISQTIQNVQTFTKALADNSDNVSAFLHDVGEAAKSIARVADNLNGMSGDIQKLILAVSPEKIDHIVSNVSATSDQLVAFAKAFDSAKAQAVIDDVSAFTKTLADVRQPLQVFATNASSLAAQLNAAAPKVDNAVGNFEKFAQSLGDSTTQVKQIVADASELAGKLNRTADQLDGIMKNITAMTSSQGGQGMFNEISETAKSIRQLANNLDARTAILSKNLDQFTGSGLRDYQQIAVDGQKTLQNIQRTLNSLQRNPQQLIFGPKSNIPDYKGK